MRGKWGPDKGSNLELQAKIEWDLAFLSNATAALHKQTDSLLSLQEMNMVIFKKKFFLASQRL